MVLFNGVSIVPRYQSDLLSNARHDTRFIKLLSN